MKSNTTVIMFILLNAIYVIGYTIINMTIQTIPALLTNDPKQRPMVSVWTTLFNFLVPTVLSIVFNVVILKKAGGSFNTAYLSMAMRIVLALAFLGNLLCCIGISAIDNPALQKMLGRMTLISMLKQAGDTDPEHVKQMNRILQKIKK